MPFIDIGSIVAAMNVRNAEKEEQDSLAEQELLDKFACAALTGLLAKGELSYQQSIIKALELAKLMLKVRSNEGTLQKRTQGLG